MSSKRLRSAAAKVAKAAKRQTKLVDAAGGRCGDDGAGDEQRGQARPRRAGGASRAGRNGVTKEMYKDLRVTALYAAVAKEKEAAVRFLLDRGANPSLADSTGGTPLMAAAVKGCQADHAAADGGEGRHSTPWTRRTGGTAFHYACFYNQPDCAEALVRAGCDTSLRTKDGMTGREHSREGQHGGAGAAERWRRMERMGKHAGFEDETGKPCARSSGGAAKDGDQDELSRLLDGGHATSTR